MQIAILGAGALGSILAVHLARAGHAVEVIARGWRAEQLQEAGLRLTGLVEDTLPCAPATPDSVQAAPDLLVLTCKTYQMAEALSLLRHLRPAAVFSVANGVRKSDELIATFGVGPVLGCMANFSGELHPDGRVEFTRNECLHLGALPGGDAGKAREMVAALNTAGIVAAAEDDILSIEWTKFCGWVAFMAMAVLTRLPTGTYVSDERVASVMAAIVREMASLAAAEGIDVRDAPLMPVASVAGSEPAAAAAQIRAVGEVMQAQAPGHHMSALQDVIAGRRLEVEGTLGDALARARGHGLDMPTLALCHALVSAVDELRSG